ncbi:MAG: hypothetical protein AAF722_11235 [Cyanobacteria bacterium P01_C01_bin.70]
MKMHLLWAAAAITLSFISFVPPAQAGNCYRYHGHEICLNQVKRSAKYHWRYRVQATVDGEQQPLTRYNCRDRTQTPLVGPQKGRTQKFTALGMGDRLCRLVNR